MIQHARGRQELARFHVYHVFNTRFLQIFTLNGYMQIHALTIESQICLPTSCKVWSIVMHSSFLYSFRNDIVLSYIFGFLWSISKSEIREEDNWVELNLLKIHTYNAFSKVRVKICRNNPLINSYIHKIKFFNNRGWFVSARS